MALCSLHHVIDLDWMKEAYRLTRKDGAPGIDGVTAVVRPTGREDMAKMVVAARSSELVPLGPPQRDG